MDESTGLLLSALRFAAEKHKDQRRKGADASPYVNHLIQVAETLWTVGNVRDATLLVASILHDTLEDTDATSAEIRAQFGEEVLALVLEVTDDRSLSQKERKQLQVETASHKSPKAKLLKIADKISNVQDIITSPPKTWSQERKQEYLSWTERVVTGLRGENENLERYYDDLLTKGRQLLGME